MVNLDPFEIDELARHGHQTSSHLGATDVNCEYHIHQVRRVVPIDQGQTFLQGPVGSERHAAIDEDRRKPTRVDEHHMVVHSPPALGDVAH